MPERRNPLTLSREDWRGAIHAAPEGKPVEKWLVESFLALSPLICREIAFRAYGDTSILVGDALSHDNGAAFADAVAALCDDARSGKFSPCILLSADGGARDFSYTTITQYGAAIEVRRIDDVSALLDEFFTKKSKDSRAKARAAELVRLAKTSRERAMRRVSAQREELSAAGNRDYNRECGDMIIANLHEIKKGMSEFTGEDYYRGGTRTIALDTQKTPQANAAKYFKEYTKAKNAELRLAEQIALGETEIEYLGSVLSELGLAESESELESIRRELVAAGYVKPPKTKSREKIRTSAPRKFTAPSGAEILVGRDNTQNDELTFKTSFKTDVWLHVKNRHGSHVILRARGAVPDEDDIVLAAQLAAYYSEAREDGRVAVDYCLVKYVKKPPGAKPGMVIYSEYKTVAVTPEK
jgi:predicted ribosome quality control (RQC) complex YloA/Tae2 family protein